MKQLSWPEPDGLVQCLQRKEGIKLIAVLASCMLPSKCRVPPDSSVEIDSPNLSPAVPHISDAFSLLSRLRLPRLRLLLLFELLRSLHDSLVRLLVPLRVIRLVALLPARLRFIDIFSEPVMTSILISFRPTTAVSGNRVGESVPWSVDRADSGADQAARHSNDAAEQRPDEVAQPHAYRA